MKIETEKMHEFEDCIQTFIKRKDLGPAETMIRDKEAIARKTMIEAMQKETQLQQALAKQSQDLLIARGEVKGLQSVIFDMEVALREVDGMSMEVPIDA